MAAMAQFEEFAHLRQEIQKLIIYSTVETVMYIDRANLWTTDSWTPRDIKVFGYAVAVREGMNIICLCHTRDSEEWPEPDQRVTMELRGPGLICLHPTPDLDSRWQALIITERSPLSLEETALISMGFHYIRRESDVEKWEHDDWRIKRAHGIYVQPLAQFKLTLAQKVLLMYNTTGMHRHSCISMFRDDIGHVSQALFSQIPYYQAFDWDFVVDHQDRHSWFELQLVHMIDSQYWKSVLCSHGIFDFQNMWVEHGYYMDSESENCGSGPDYNSELVPRVLSTWES